MLLFYRIQCQFINLSILKAPTDICVDQARGGLRIWQLPVYGRLGVLIIECRQLARPSC